MRKHLRLRFLLSLGMIITALSASADQSAQRITPGMSLSLQGQLLDLSAPVCAPAPGSYSVAYRNSIATGCSIGRSSDDFATLVFAGNAPATYTMPQSTVTTFTGSISGTTLTTPANAVTIGSVITGVGVLDNTYVTATTNSTTWTVNNSQTVGSETLTQAVYPPGHGTCFKSDTSATALLTVTATTSTIRGAAGVVNGSPAVKGGPIVLYPGGEVCLQADTTNNYLASGFLPGSWYQVAGPAAPASSYAWTGLSGYPRLHLSCSGLSSVTSAGQVVLQLAYAGTFQTTGYTWMTMGYYAGGSAVLTGSGTTATGIVLTGSLNTNSNFAGTIDVDLSFAFGTGMGFSNDIKATARLNDAFIASGGPAESEAFTSGSAPLTTTQPVTGVQIFPTVGTLVGMCWLAPRT